MTLTLIITIAAVGLAAGFVVFRAIPGLRAYFDYRGKRLITCPETHTTEAVDVAAGKAAVGAFLSKPTLHLKECSRWPEREDCGQECLQQVETDAGNCLLWNIVSQWYAGKSCAFCHKEIGGVHPLDHAPALLTRDQKTVEWKEFRPEQLPEVFESCRPVCWNCHVAETFRRRYPDLVVDRKVEAHRTQ